MACDMLSLWWDTLLGEAFGGGGGVSFSGVLSHLSLW